MRSFAVSILVSLSLTLLPVVPDKERVRCTCRPSPPGGVTECQSGQIAVCGGREGVCKGSCISVSAQLQPLQYSAALLTKVLQLDREATVDELKKDRKNTKQNLEALIDGSKRDAPVSIKYGGIARQVGVGLTEVAIKKLKQAIAALSTNLTIPVPRGILGQR